MTNRKIVNGALLRNNIGQTVSIMVHAEDVKPQTTTFHAKTTDDMEVQINLTEPLNVSVNGWIEVIGVPNSPSSIQNNEVSKLSNSY